MPNPAFEIDDTLTVDENISALADCLTGVDAPLAHVLRASFVDLSHDIGIDQGALLNALYAATAPVDEPLSPAPQA